MTAELQAELNTEVEAEAKEVTTKVAMEVSRRVDIVEIMEAGVGARAAAQAIVTPEADGGATLIMAVKET